MGGNAVVAETSFHSCLLMVNRHDFGNTLFAGTGSIVTRSRVITAGHVVRAASSVQAVFYQRRVSPEQLRRADSVYIQTFQSFNSQTLENDIAVIVFPNYSFTYGNIIRISAITPNFGEAFVAGYGFKDPLSTSPSLVPLMAPHTITSRCTSEVPATGTHFCAVASNASVLCPGDNGAGICTGSGSSKKLVSKMYLEVNDYN